MASIRIADPVAVITAGDASLHAGYGDRLTNKFDYAASS